MVLFGSALFGGCFSATPSRKSHSDAASSDTFGSPNDSRNPSDTTDANGTSGSTGGSTVGQDGGSQGPGSSGGNTITSGNGNSGSGGSWGSGSGGTNTSGVVGTGGMAGENNTGGMVGGSIVTVVDAGAGAVTLVDAGAGAAGTTPDAATPDRPVIGGLSVGGASSGGVGGARTGGTTTGSAVADAAIPSDTPVPPPDAGAPLGTSCTTGTTCASGVCADGVCCDKACSGCNACTNDLTGKPTGQCQPVQNGKIAHGACTASGTTCGTDGFCDGKGSCRVTAKGTSCGSTCTGSTFTPKACDGAGACASGASSECTPYACSGDVCGTSCAAGENLCGNTCVDLQTDANNCGTCNHGCLGGTCSEGNCQPWLLADEAAIWEGVATYMVSGDKVFIEFGARGYSPTDWTVDINGGGAVKLRDVPAVTGEKTRTVVLDGSLFWFTFSGTTGQLLSCPQNTCTPANTSTVLTTTIQDGWSLGVPNIIADPVNHEIVWHEQAYYAPTVVYSHTAKRSGPTGPARSVGSYVTSYSDTWLVHNNRPDRVFSLRNDDSTYSTYTLYSLLTNTTSASPLAITGSMSTVSSYSPFLANSTAAFIGTSASLVRVPLPNGVVGVPPAFYTGSATWSLAEDTNVFGTTVGATNDGIWRCSISNCNPSYISRGFLTYGYLISDSTSVYILDRTSSGTRFKLWRMAK
jgi:hypothetical protein